MAKYATATKTKCGLIAVATMIAKIAGHLDPLLKRSAKIVNGATAKPADVPRSRTEMNGNDVMIKRK